MKEIKLLNQGFTLLELLVVVLIIGILAAIALPQYKLAVAKSKFAEVLLLTNNIKQQQEVFYLSNGYYATNCEVLNPELPSGGYITEDREYIELNKGSENIKITCSNGGNTRVGMLSPNANFELQLDNAERKNALQGTTYKGFCRAITDVGHRICKEIGTLVEGKANYQYFF